MRNYAIWHFFLKHHIEITFKSEKWVGNSKLQLCKSRLSNMFLEA